MKDRSGEAHRWYDEAGSDVAFARVGLREGFYYVPTRYPNALPGGVPHRSYTEEQAREAIFGCEQVMAAVREELRQGGIAVK